MAEAKVIDVPAVGLLSEALDYLQRSLVNLDEAAAPADIGAHVDWAIVRLQEHMSRLKR